MWTLLDGFSHLHATELDALLEAPALITVLVGAADGDLDREERTWSDRLMQSRTYNNPKHLNAYYSVVANGFMDKLDAFMAEYPEDVDQRSQLISDKLSKLNPILAKLDQPLRADLYLSYLGLAKETAKASGGFLRIGAISAAEAVWINLPMLDVVAEAQYQQWQDEVAPDDEELEK